MTMKTSTDYREGFRGSGGKHVDSKLSPKNCNDHHIIKAHHKSYN